MIFIGATQTEVYATVRGGLLKMDSTGATPVQARCVGNTAIIYASDYLNKLTGERIERECKNQLDAGRHAVVINFRDTELVNSIGVSILMGVIDAAEQSQARLVFCDVNAQSASLFEMLGLTKHVKIAVDENEALLLLETPATSTAANRF